MAGRRDPRKSTAVVGSCGDPRKSTADDLWRDDPRKSTADDPRRRRDPRLDAGQNDGWYSFEQGSAHFIMLNTEMSSKVNSSQYDFVQNDLKAIDRSKTPWVFVFGHRQMYFGRAELPNTSRGDAAAATWLFRRDASRRRCGRDVDISWRRVAAALRLPLRFFVETRRRRGYDVDIPRRWTATAGT